MKDLVNIIYQKFITRALLGKIGPGFLATIFIIEALNINYSQINRAGSNFDWLFLIEGILLFWIVGVAIQVLAENIGLYSSRPRPKRLLFFFVPKNWEQVNKDFETRLSRISNASPDKWGEGARDQREHYIDIGEASGNFASALVIAIICLLTMDNVTNKYYIVGFLSILSITLFVSHYTHAISQANFEITTLENSGLLSKDEAESMRKHIERY